MERVFLIESSAIVQARLFVSEDLAAWREAPPWPESGAGNGFSYFNPAFALSLKPGQELHVLACYQTVSGMTPLFSIRTVADLQERLSLYMIGFGAMVAGLLLAMIYMGSLWRITQEKTIPVILLFAPFAGGFAGLMLGLYRIFFPEFGSLSAHYIALFELIVCGVFIADYIIREAGLVKSAKPLLGRRVYLPAVCMLMALPILVFDAKIGMDTLIVAGNLCALLLTVISVATIGKSRTAGWHVAIAVVLQANCLAYVFAWYDLVPSDWITWLASVQAPLLACFLAMVVLCKLRDRDRYLGARLEYSDRVFNREVDRRAAARVRVFASVKHDLRQAVQSIGLLLNLLKGKTLDEEGRDITQRMVRAYDSLTRLVDGFFDVARLNAGVLVPRRQVVALDAMFSLLAIEFRNAATAKRLELRYLPCRVQVKSDPRLLERMVRNLLTNAITNTTAGRIVLGGRRRAGGLVEIQVLDTGPGMPRAVQRKIFASQPLAGPDGRSGLGLFIVMEVAKILGHRMQITSKRGKGSCISVLAERVRDGQPVQPFDEGDLRGLRVLCCLPGNSISLVWLQRLLKTHGCKVQLATDAQKAMAFLVDGAVPDVAIADETVLGVLEHLENLLRQPIPTIVLTRGAGTTAIRVFDRINRVVLYKPVRPSVLLQALNALVRPGAQGVPAQEFPWSLPPDEAH